MKLSPSRIQAARRHLRAADPVMNAIIDAVGPYTLRFERDRFAMLVRSIVSQQKLLELAGPEGLTAANLARFTIEELRSVGLSLQKVAYVADLAAKVNDGSVDLRRIGRLPDDAVIETLTQVKGIGVWTAQMFLIFALGRPNVFPHADLGVRTAIRDRYGLAELPDRATSHAIAALWQPYASVASWYCWPVTRWTAVAHEGGCWFVVRLAFPLKRKAPTAGPSTTFSWTRTAFRLSLRSNGAATLEFVEKSSDRCLTTPPMRSFTGRWRRFGRSSKADVRNRAWTRVRK